MHRRFLNGCGIAILKGIVGRIAAAKHLVDGIASIGYGVRPDRPSRLVHIHKHIGLRRTVGVVAAIYRACRQVGVARIVASTVIRTDIDRYHAFHFGGNFINIIVNISQTSLTAAIDITVVCAAKDVDRCVVDTAAVVAYSGAVYCDGKRAHYDSAPAPTFFLHGDKDKIVNYKKFPPLLRSGLYGPTKLHRLFEKKGYPHWYFIYEGIGHEVSGLMNYTIQEFDAFVDKTLAGSRMQYDATLRDSNVRPTKWTSMNVFELYKGK